MHPADITAHLGSHPGKAYCLAIGNAVSMQATAIGPEAGSCEVSQLQSPLSHGYVLTKKGLLWRSGDMKV